MIPKLLSKEDLYQFSSKMERLASRLTISNLLRKSHFAGNQSSNEQGSSIDFLDHRPYYMGDDLRHINWQAYARTGSYTMKVFSNESLAAVDFFVDISLSMLWEDEKKIEL